MKTLEMVVILFALVIVANVLEVLIYKFTQTRISSPSFVAGMLWILYSNWKEKQ
jgi:hypothetical protein